MGIIVRQSVSNTIISYAGISLGFIVTIFLYPHILQTEEYGLTRVLISASYICSQFAHLGFHSLVIRYFPFFKKADPDHHGLLFWVVTVPFAGFLLFTIIYFLAGHWIIRIYENQSPLFVEYYLWVIPLTLFVLYYEVLNSYLRSLRDSVTGSLVNEILQRLLVIGLLLVYFFGLISFEWFIILFVGSYLLQPLVIVMRIIRKGEFRLKPNIGIIRKPLVRGMVRYSMYTLMGGLTTVMIWNVDVLMLGSMAGLAQTGIYAVAFYIASVVSIPQRSIEKIAAPLISGFIKNKEWAGVGTIYRKTSLNQLIPGLLIFGLIWLNLDVLFMLLPDDYSAGKWVVFIIGFGKLFEAATGANGAILLNSKYYRVSFFTNVLLVVVTIGANYLLIPPYGIEGAAIASALALFTFNSVKYLFILVKLKLQPFTMATYGVAVLGFSVIYICYSVIHFDNLYLDILIKNGVFICFYFVPLLYLNVSPDLNNLLVSIKKRIFP